MLSGQKVWISTAQVANKILLLTRTTPVEQARGTEGLTLFYTDLDRSKIEVRRIPKMGRKAVALSAHVGKWAECDRLIEEAHVEHHAGGGRPRRFWRWTEAGHAADLEIRRILADLCAIPLGSEAGSAGKSDPGAGPDQILDRPTAAADLAGRTN